MLLCLPDRVVGVSLDDQRIGSNAEQETASVPMQAIAG
jgi:hypothetical protein